MKSFRYTAQNAQGEKVIGNIESTTFDNALEHIKQQGLQVMAIEESKQEQVIQELRPHMFEAILPEEEELDSVETAENVSRESDPLHQEPSQMVEVKVQDEEPEPDREPSPEENPREEPIDFEEQKKTPEEKKEEGILFPRKEAIEEQKKQLGEGELNEMEYEKDMLLKKVTDEEARNKLEYLGGKIDLLKESPHPKRLKNFKREFKRVMKDIQYELEKNEQKKWEEYEKKAPHKTVESYDDFEEQEKEANKSLSQEPSKRKWWQVLDEPDENNEQEVLKKQQYESMWNETQRFSGVLVGFYLLTYFIAYYLKRVGIEDHFMVRIYDTTLFKQIIVILFTAFVGLTLRKEFLPKKLQSDVALLLVFLISSVIILN